MRSIVLSLALLLTACGATDTVLQSGKQTNQSNVDPARLEFSEDFAGVERAGFLFVFVLRRKDGGKIDGDDRAIIRANTIDVNRRVATDDDKAVIIGSNYIIDAANLKALYDRFAVEDFSPTPTPTPLSANSNSAK